MRSLFVVSPGPGDIVSPCDPTPCGSNAVCKVSNGAGSCTCLPDYIGNPYDACRPECVINSDCPSHQSCVRTKCRDPCPGACAANAECIAINHAPSCTCLPGLTGDPFTFCNQPPYQRKSLEIMNLDRFERDFFSFFCDVVMLMSFISPGS